MKNVLPVLKLPLLLMALLVAVSAEAKEIALTFDDAPVGATLHFDSRTRTETLIKKLKALNVSGAMIFANPCKQADAKDVIEQLELYKKAGHVVGNHTCRHLRFDNAGFAAFTKEITEADALLHPLLKGQKYFRFPYLNEGKDAAKRDEMRTWLDSNGYFNAAVSIDNDDTIVSDRINKAKALGKKIDYVKVRELFLKHILSAVAYYDDLAVKELGYSPKHVLLLHEIDGTVLYIDDLVTELRARGWKIISAEEAYKDPLYLKRPKNTYAGNGLIAQVVTEKTGVKPAVTFYKWDELEKDLDLLLGL